MIHSIAVAVNAQYKDNVFGVEAPLLLDNGAGSRFQDCVFINHGAPYAIHVSAQAGGDESYGVKFDHCQFYGFKHAIHIDDNSEHHTNGWSLVDCSFDRNEIALYLNRVGYWKIDGGCINGSAKKGIWLSGTVNKIIAVHFERNPIDIHIASDSLGTLVLGGDPHTIQDDTIGIAADSYETQLIGLQHGKVMR